MHQVRRHLLCTDRQPYTGPGCTAPCSRAVHAPCARRFSRSPSRKISSSPSIFCSSSAGAQLENEISPPHLQSRDRSPLASPPQPRMVTVNPQAQTRPRARQQTLRLAPCGLLCTCGLTCALLHTHAPRLLRNANLRRSRAVLPSPLQAVPRQGNMHRTWVLHIGPIGTHTHAACTCAADVRCACLCGNHTRHQMCIGAYHMIMRACITT